VDEGQPIAYPVLEKGVSVLSRDGEEVGTVHHVVAAPEQDIFHGLVISSPRLGKRFVPAEDVASLHERGVDLRIDASEVASLPHPHGAAPAYREREPGVKPHSWQKYVDMLTGKSPLSRNWSKED
jgi:sporulation protein YlmC with PRC-barrel domain